MVKVKITRTDQTTKEFYARDYGASEAEGRLIQWITEKDDYYYAPVHVLYELVEIGMEEE